MNTIKLMKNFEFDFNTFKDLNLKYEFISILDMFLKEYKYYDEVYKKNVYKKNIYTSSVKNLEELIKNIETKKLKLQAIIDDKKICKSTYIYDKDESQYIFDMIYDSEGKTYTITFKPSIQEAFNHYNFKNSFKMIYDEKNNSLYATKLSKHINDMIYEIYCYKRNCTNNPVVTYDIKKYDGNIIKKIENENNFFETYNKIDDLLIETVPNVAQKLILASKTFKYPTTYLDIINQRSEEKIYATIYNVYDNNNYIFEEKYIIGNCDTPKSFKSINVSKPMSSLASNILHAHKVEKYKKEFLNKKIKIK